MNVNIQYQDVTGSWYTIGVTENEASRILMAMQGASRQYPGCRIRAIDENGRIVDLL